MPTLDLVMTVLQNEHNKEHKQSILSKTKSTDCLLVDPFHTFADIRNLRGSEGKG